MKMELQIDGMSCQHCVRAVEEALTGVAGVEVNAVQVGSASITASAETGIEQIRMAIEEEGFTVGGVTELV